MATAQKQTARKPAKARIFSEGEKAAMLETVRERKAQAGSKDPRADGEHDLLAKIAELPAAEKDMAKRLHAIITAAAPDLWPKTWYGMPAYARDGKVVCFFKPASKFKTRYATFGFEEAARLDDGAMWPTSYALTSLTKADEAKIAELVKKSVG
jgi:uncharacterized protein YdhG (YjbR/CyaY superfamily)